MVKKDDTGKRWVEMELLVSGTPEQAWHAMATGPGYTAWFTRTEIEERAGGAIRFQFGAEVISTGEVTVWEPPHRFSYVEREWNEGAPQITTDITIRPWSGNRCLVRMVHWLVSESEVWDEQMESFEIGWAGFFDILRVYLTSFAGRKAASFGAMTSVEGDQLSVWLRLTEKLGLAGASVGERRTLTGPEALTGTVERAHQDAHSRSILVRLHEPSGGVVLAGTYPAAGRTNASLGVYIYGENAADAAAASEPMWQNWFKETFPA